MEIVFFYFSYFLKGRTPKSSDNPTVQAIESI